MRKKPLILAALAGAATVGGYAPYAWFLLPVLTLAVLVWLWQRAASARDAALTGFAFGLGCFSAGVSWVYVSLHDFGAMPAWLAIALTLLLCAYLALFPALTGWLCHTLGGRSPLVTLATVPALWTLTEWLRGWLFTGFPWLAIGYSQVPDSPLAGYVPVLGIYGASFLTAASATLLALAVARMLQHRQPGALGTVRRWSGHAGLPVLALLWAGGFALQHVVWTVPAGAAISVALIQGNIAQDLKWRDDRVFTTLAAYRELIAGSEARLTVLPETALPLFLHNVPRDYLDAIAAHARRHNGDVLLGVPERLDARTYYNSVLSVGSAPEQFYRKSHLVPFGEFVPLKLLFGWFLDVANIPLADFARGEISQQPLAVAGQQVAVNICYEDVFGAEIARQLPQASLLVNVSNVAWFGRSIAPRQHLQISQARALETGRPMLRATNTGMTAIIDAHGRVQSVAPEFTASVVRGEISGHSGVTPYVRWHDGPVLLVALLLAAAAAIHRFLRRR